MVIVLMGLYIYSKKLMWICLYKYTFSHFLTIKSEHDVFIIPTYIQIHPNIHTNEAIKNDKLYKSIIGNDWDRRCHCWEPPLHHEVLIIYLEISLSCGHVFLFTMTTPSMWPLSCSQATEIAFFLPFLLPILPHAYIFYTTAEWLFLRWIRSLPCIILRCLHIASIPECEPVTIAFEALSHLPSPAFLLSAPTILPQNPCSSSQISQSWEQSEAFPTSEVCVLASSASNTIPAPSAPDRDSPFRSQSAWPPLTIPLPSPPPAPSPKLNMSSCCSLSRYPILPPFIPY